MALRQILTEPNKILRQKSKPVETVGEEERNIMDDMLETMYDANGIGLAAIQIGIPKRIIVMDISKNDEKIGTVTSQVVTGDGFFALGFLKRGVESPTEAQVINDDLEEKNVLVMPLEA